MIRKIAQFGNRLVLVPSSGVRLNLIWMAAGSAMQAASGWLSVVVLAKLGSPNVVGSYALAVAIVVPTIALLNLQLRENMVTDARASRPFSDYYRLRLITVTVALFAISLLGLVALDGAFSWGLLAAVTVGKLAEAVSDIVYGVFQKRERLDLVAKFVSCRSILGVTALWGVMMVSRNAVLACLASSLCSVGVLALAEIKASARFANSAAPVDSGLQSHSP